MRLAIIFLLSLSPCALQAQAVPPSLTVDDAVKAAIRQNPSVSAAARDVLAADAGIRSARALGNPEVVFTPRLTTGGSDTEFSARQPLEVNGTRSARVAIASARRLGAAASAIVALRETVFAARSAYYELARARELLAVSQDLLSTAEEFDRITRRQVELGSRPGIDRTQTGIEVTRARQQVSQAEAQVRVATAALNTVMGRTPAEPVEALSRLSAEPVRVDPAGAADQAVARRAEIRADEAERDALVGEARLARAEGRPDVTAQYRATRVVGGLDDAGFGVAVTLPLIDHGALRHRARQAQLAARAQEDRIAARTNQVRQEAGQAVARLGAAEAVLKDYAQGLLEQSRHLLDAARIGFQSGQTSVIAVLEARRTFRSVQTEYANAVVDRALALAEFERATGAVPATLLPGLADKPIREGLSR